MSLYADYLRERGEAQIIEKDYGFATYSISNQECYIRDIFVQKELRKNNFATVLADEIKQIAKSKGCKYMTGSVCPSAFGADASIKVLMAYGMNVHSATNNLIIFKKDIL